MKLNFVFILLFSILQTACLEQSSNLSSVSDSEKNPSPYSPSADIRYQADIIIEPIDLDATPLAGELFDSLPSNPRYTMISGPSWLQVDSVTGKFSITTKSNEEPTAFELKATQFGNPLVFMETGALTVAVNGDPLRYQQWHIYNDGNTKTYSSRAGVSGIDLNVSSVYEAGITGKGIKVAVSDSGAEINHDDLKDNILAGKNRDYTRAAPYYGDPIATSPHGTAVSGIIAAKGWNNKGGIGVAPNAFLNIFQFLNSSQSSAIMIDQASGDYDIFNYSYGDTLFYDTRSDENYLDHVRYQTLTNRKFYLKAAGNEYAIGEGSICAPHNANAPFENESPFMIVIGAINAEGEKAMYSNVGSNLWVSAPGGEYGDSDPAILTTDLPTCFKGFSKAKNYVTNSFEYGHPENPKCNYTSTMNGTSSAAPMVSGVIALILEANPSLSYRDVKHILAVTATQIDPNQNNIFGKKHPSIVFSGCSDLNLAGYQYEQGWIKNKANIYFNNFYGFGLVDAASAVSLAKGSIPDPMSWLPLPTQVELNPEFANTTYDTGIISLAIPDNISTGVTRDLPVSANIKVESIQLKIEIQHPKSGEVGVEVTSPMGTKSILMNINNSFLLDDDANLNITLASHAFYGEDSVGTWTVKVIDGREGNEGTLTRFRLNILGH